MNRRQFIQAGSALLTGGVVAAGCAGRSGTRFRWSTSSIHFKSLPFEQACERIASLGFEAIDVWCAYEQCPHLDDVLQRLGPDGLKAVLATHRLKLFAFSTYVGGYPKYAKLLGAAGGGVAVQSSAGPCLPSELSARMRTFFEGLKPQAELAAQQKSLLAIENHGQSLLDGPDSFKAFVDLNPYPSVGVALAPYHLQSLKASVPDVIRTAGRQLLFFYAWQNAPGTGQLPGHGPVDFAPCLQALADVRYGGYVNPFMHGHVEPEVMTAALTKSLKYLKGIA